MDLRLEITKESEHFFDKKALEYMLNKFGFEGLEKEIREHRQKKDELIVRYVFKALPADKNVLIDFECYYEEKLGHEFEWVKD